MPDPDRLLDLIVEWEDGRRAGRDASAAELCPDDPELQRALGERLAKRRKLHAYLGDPAPAAGGAEPRGDPVPVVPGYEVEAVLGAGGMGVVYRARDVRLGRTVALKLIRGGAGAVQLSRFRGEATAVAALQHPNIVQIYDVGEAGGQAYLALEFVPGGTLAEHLGGRPAPPRRAAEVLLRLAEAVAHAHAAGIVHRDLKPANVLLSAAGEPKVADFGLAKRLDEDLRHTQTGAILGSPCYMAPEQAEGRAADVGPATDVHALGAVLYEALTGRPPFAGTTVLETLDQVRTLDPVPPGDLRPEVPRDLEKVCLKCLEKRPADRYASAADLAEDLRRFLAGERVRVRPPSLVEAVVRAVRRNNYDPGFGRFGATMLAAAPVVLAYGGGLFFALRGRADFPHLMGWATLASVVAALAYLTLANAAALRAVAPAQRRQWTNVWWSAAAAMAAEWVILRAAVPGDRPGDLLLAFPLWTAQVAVGYLSFASEAGAFYAVGGFFLAAALLGALLLPWSPLVLFSAVVLTMVAMGLSLRAVARRLDQERAAAP